MERKCESVCNFFPNLLIEVKSAVREVGIEESMCSHQVGSVRNMQVSRESRRAIANHGGIISPRAN